jgi:hypothetical protein
VRIEIEGESSRSIEVSAIGDGGEALIAALGREWPGSEETC